MALGSFGSFLGQVGRVLPGYVEGYRNAVSDNWNDMKNYNEVHQGQRENLLNDMLVPYDFRREVAQSGDAELRHYVNALNTDLHRRMFPGNAAMADAFSGFAPHAAALNYGNQLRQLMLIERMLLSGRLMPFGQGGNMPLGMGGNTPTPSSIGY